MTKNEVLMTITGLKKMEEELEYLKTVRRKEVASRIKQAIEFGDISENSEYEDAKNEQAFIEGSILDLEQKLRNASIIDANEVDVNVVSVGSTVRLKNHTKGIEVEYTIVGSVESDPTKNKISNESPVGKALIGNPVGSKINIMVPSGSVEMEILEIRK
ncbi:MAG: transcription elongation factor GreA [Bacillota bacterium]|jgi:transcription elongation factor GreA